MAEVPHPVEVVICTYAERREELRRCLDSVSASHCRPHAVFVVDNASHPGIAAMLAAEFPGVTVIHHAENRGFARAMNEAIASHCRGEYVLMLNDDACLTPDCLGRLAAVLARDPGIAAVQPKVKSLDGDGRFDYAGAAGGYMDRYGYPFLRGRLVNHIEQDEGQYNSAGAVFWASGAVLLIRRESFVALGGFDETFVNYMEEIDLAWRLQLCGYRVWVEPRAVARHRAGYAPGRMAHALSFLKHRNSLQMLLKNYSIAALARCLPVRLVLDIGSVVVAAGRGDPAYAWIIVKSWLALIAAWPRVWRQRRAVQAMRRVPDSEALRLLYRGSLLLDWYLRGRRTFAALRWTPGAAKDGDR